MEDNRLVYSFPRGQGEEIQAAIRKYKGKYFVDLRLWYQGKDERTFLPTKKGVSFAVDSIPELQKAVERLHEEAGKLDLTVKEAVS